MSVWRFLLAFNLCCPFHDVTMYLLLLSRSASVVLPVEHLSAIDPGADVDGVTELQIVSQVLSHPQQGPDADHGSLPALGALRDIGRI